MSKLDDLLEKAKWGTLNGSDLAWIKDKINSPGNEGLYKLIQIIGRANRVEYTQYIESFLTFPQDPMVSRIALWSLCNYWNQTEKYLSEVKRFVDGVDWDLDGDVRLSAITIAGEYLRNHEDPELLTNLLELFEDCSERKLVRDGAYFALARMNGKEWEELPPASRLLDFSTDVDWHIIEKIREKVSTFQ